MRLIPVLLLVVVLLAAARPARADVEAPRWSAGDFWDYRVRIAVEDGLLILNGTLRVTVASLGPAVVKNATVVAYTTQLVGRGDVQTSGTGPQVHGRWNLSGEQRVESVGFKVVSSVTEVDANGVADPFIPFWFQVQNATESAILTDTWQYPLDVGKAGTLVTNTSFRERVRFGYGTTSQDTTAQGTYNRSLAFDARGASRVTAPAGGFDALELRIAWPSGETDSWFYSAAVGNNVRTETRNATGGKVAEGELLTYRYRALEPPASFLGLPLMTWSVVAGAVAGASIAAVAWFLLRRRRGRGGGDAASRSPGVSPGRP